MLILRLCVVIEQPATGLFPYKNCMEEKNFLKRARSLLVVTASPPSPSQYEVFTKKVSDFTSRDPFKFSTPVVFKSVSFVKASIN